MRCFYYHAEIDKTEINNILDLLDKIKNNEFELKCKIGNNEIIVSETDVKKYCVSNFRDCPRYIESKNYLDAQRGKDDLMKDFQADHDKKFS